MSYQLLLTTLGAQKLATAGNAGGAPIRIAEFAVGQGVNVDFSTRLDKQTLVAKRYQGKVESVAPVAGRPNQYEVHCVVPIDVGGFAIREMGLIDADGVLIWVGSLPEVQKPDGSSVAAVDYRIKAVIQIDNPTVNIMVDTHAITATRGWVQDNFVSKPQFASFLEILFPMGYPYWSSINENPKPQFDLLFGYETFWQRLEGVELLAVKDNDAQINRPNRFVGKNGDVIADSATPDQYRGYTDYLWIRTNGNKPPVKYDGKYRYDGSAQYQ